MSEEVGHPCPTDIPPVLSTSTTTKATANAEALPEAGPDHGGGGDGDINEAQAQRTADNRDRVRQFLTDAGCRAGDVDRLAHAVLSEPDGPERMAKTYRGLEGNVGSPIAVLVHRIRNGTLDELDKADRRRGALDTLADDIARRGYRNLNDWLADMTAKIEDAPGVRIPVPLQNLLGLNGSAALDSERQRVSDKDPERRRRWLAGMELEVVRSLSAASGKDAVAA